MRLRDMEEGNEGLMAQDQQTNMDLPPYPGTAGGAVAFAPPAAAAAAPAPAKPAAATTISPPPAP